MAAQTIIKALKSKINYPLDEDSYTTALIDAGLDGDKVYTKDSRREVELCAAALILVVCTSGNVSEGGYSITFYDKNALMKTRSIYLANWNEPDNDPDRPKVSAGEGLW